MKRTVTLFSILLGLALALAASSRSIAAEAKYLGSKTCKGCHKEAYEHWEKSTKHAKAFEALKAEDRKKADCVGCHVVGIGKPGGYDMKGKDADNAKVAGVGCESCHGPGGGYLSLMTKAKKSGWDLEAAKKAGLVVPDEKTCTGCHNKKSPNFKEFKFAESLKKVAHPKVEKK